MNRLQKFTVSLLKNKVATSKEPYDTAKELLLTTL